jgi:hypothetical protein
VKEAVDGAVHGIDCREGEKRRGGSGGRLQE